MILSHHSRRSLATTPLAPSHQELQFSLPQVQVILHLFQLPTTTSSPLTYPACIAVLHTRQPSPRGPEKTSKVESAAVFRLPY